MLWFCQYGRECRWWNCCRLKPDFKIVEQVRYASLKNNQLDLSQMPEPSKLKHRSCLQLQMVHGSISAPRLSLEFHHHVCHEQEGKVNLTSVDLTRKCEVLKGKPLRGSGKQIQSLGGSFYEQVGREGWARWKGRKNTRPYFLPLDGLCPSSRTITPIIIVIKSLHLKSIMTATEGTFPPLGII